MERRVHTVVCPVDFSPVSNRAAEEAAKLCRGFGAKLHLVHVYQLPIYAMPDGAMVATPDLAARLSSQLQDELNRLVERLDQQTASGTALDMATHLVEGVPHIDVASVAKDVGADMIIMSTHGRSGLERFLLGSVAEKVIRTSSIPVLVLPAADPQSVSSKELAPKGSA